MSRGDLLMSNRLPAFSGKKKICIICEGNEEYSYLKKLNSLGVWSDQYEIVLSNAEGNGNIPARYQDAYQNDTYELVLVFCDTEKKPYEQYGDIKKKINDFHGKTDVEDQVIIFGNPCTMQIILKHWTDEIITSPAKPVNAPLVKACVGVENYKGRSDHIKAVMKHITAENYKQMCQRVSRLKKIDTVIGSSNFDLFMNNFESDNSIWINKINETLET